MEPSLKAKRGLSRTALQILEWRSGYQVLDWLQAPSSYLFWLIERCKAWLQNLLANEGREP